MFVIVIFVFRWPLYINKNYSFDPFTADRKSYISQNNDSYRIRKETYLKNKGKNIKLYTIVEHYSYLLRVQLKVHLNFRKMCKRVERT